MLKMGDFNVKGWIVVFRFYEDCCSCIEDFGGVMYFDRSYDEEIGWS